jgi:hypothetical protein
MWCSVRASKEDLKKEEKEDMKEERKKKYRKEENEIATAQWQFVEISYTKCQQNQSQNMEVSDKS